MPVRSSSSSVLRWPDARSVHRAVSRWAAAEASNRPGVLRIGYFGSYARGDWGVGSDLDLVAVVEASERPFALRPTDWDTTPLPVPADLLVYTLDEWASLDPGSRFGGTLREEVRWVWERRAS